MIGVRPRRKVVRKTIYIYLYIWAGNQLENLREEKRHVGADEGGQKLGEEVTETLTSGRQRNKNEVSDSL